MDSQKSFNTLGYEVTVKYPFVSSILHDLSDGLSKKYINIKQIANHIVNTTTETMVLNDLYYYMADYCATKVSNHPDFNILASRLCVARLHKTTPTNYDDVVNLLYNNNDKSGRHVPLISKELYDIVINNSKQIQERIDMSRDLLFDYFALRTLERSYLYRIHNSNQKNYYKNDKSGQIIERPQHMIMRLALGIHGDDLISAFETYDLVSQKFFTHATPTLFNAGSNRPQLASCYLLDMKDDIEGIFKTISNIAYISKWAGGIGVDLTSIRAKGSLIRGTNGLSDGIIPLCLLLNRLGKYINQGGKRNGSIATYLQPWHSDIFEFCELRKNTKDEDSKARDLFLALWIPDLFMQRVKEDGVWSLMCPDECPGLVMAYGEEFNKLYVKYEQEKKYKKQIRAIDLFYHIMDCQLETGMPYTLFKDHVNRKSNQKNVGAIRCSNLCSEIVQYTDANEIAICNLSSICLPRYVVRDENGKLMFDFNKLIQVTKVVVRNLNKVIDRNYYPTKEAEYSNFRHRPMGVGVQGLVDVYNKMGFPFGSNEAKLLNKQIFETIYFAALTSSCELAQKLGAYSTFKGSPFSEGKLQFHLWGLTEKDLTMNFDWDTLIKNIVKYGTRNSLLTALMPTATTSQIMGNSESMEPYMSNIFVRSTMAGEFIVINDTLVKELIDLGIWSDKLRKLIIIRNGSIQDIELIPKRLKDIYKTAFEIHQKDIIIQSAERGPFIDQTQSLNLFMNDSNFDVLTSCHFTSWEAGLKTGMYYLRSRPAVDPIQFGIDVEEIDKLVNEFGKRVYDPNYNKNKSKLDTRSVTIQECLNCSS